MYSGRSTSSMKLLTNRNEHEFCVNLRVAAPTCRLQSGPEVGTVPGTGAGSRPTTRVRGSAWFGQRQRTAAAAAGAPVPLSMRVLDLLDSIVAGLAAARQ